MDCSYFDKYWLIIPGFNKMGWMGVKMDANGISNLYL